MSMLAKKTQAKSAQMKSARAKSASSTRSKSAARDDAQLAELEDDAFDCAINEASKAGLLDEMIADALQAQRDGKTMPL